MNQNTYTGVQYLTPEQKEILQNIARKAPPLEQELELLRALNNMAAAGGALSEAFLQLTGEGTCWRSTLTGALDKFELSAASALVAAQQMRFLLGEESDTLGRVLGSANFRIHNKLNDLHFKYKEEPEHE